MRIWQSRWPSWPSGWERWGRWGAGKGASIYTQDIYTHPRKACTSSESLHILGKPANAKTRQLVQVLQDLRGHMWQKWLAILVGWERKQKWVAGDRASMRNQDIYTKYSESLKREENNGPQGWAWGGAGGCGRTGGHPGGLRCPRPGPPGHNGGHLHPAELSSPLLGRRTPLTQRHLCGQLISSCKYCATPSRYLHHDSLTGQA